MKIALIGYGKMGKAIEEIIDEHNINFPHLYIDIVLRIDAKNQHLLTSQYLSIADVAIEFTTPQTTVQNIFACFAAGVPVVVGTTGWYNQLQEVNKQSKIQKGCVFYAPNFSIGVNLFFELTKIVAQKMLEQTQYSISIKETHHTQKLDAPSGTAIKLAEIIMLENRQFTQWVNATATHLHQLSIESLRVDQVPGTHQVDYISTTDTISIQHIAHSRKGFAEGALKAALWIKDKKGVFTMKDMLKL